MFAGKPAKSDEDGVQIREKQVGIFDYLTLGVTDVLKNIFSGAFKTVMVALLISIIGIPLIPAVAVAFGVGALTFLLLEGVRRVTSALFTIAASPIVALVSLTSAIASFKKKREVRNINVENPHADDNLDSGFIRNPGRRLNTTLGEIMESRNSFDKVQVSLSGTTANLKAVFTTTKDGVNLTTETTFNLYQKDENGEKIIMNSEHRKAFKSLRALNVGNGNLYRQWQQVKNGDEVEAFQKNSRSPAMKK